MKSAIQILLVLTFATGCTSHKSSHMEVFNEFLANYYLVDKDFKDGMNIKIHENLIFCRLQSEDSFTLVKTTQTLNSEDVFIIDKTTNFDSFIKPLNDLLNIAHVNKFHIKRVYIEPNSNYNISRSGLDGINLPDTIVHLY